MFDHLSACRLLSQSGSPQFQSDWVEFLVMTTLVCLMLIAWGLDVILHCQVNQRVTWR